MHSVESIRSAWGISSDLQLAGFDPERGDTFRIIEETEGEQIQEGYLLPTRKRAKAEITIDGKRIIWIHYKMNLSPERLSEQESNQEQIWQQLRSDLDTLLSEDSLVLSKAGMFKSVGTVAMSRSGLLRPGNYICKDVFYSADEDLPAVDFERIPLDSLANLDPQFDEDCLRSHKMVHPYIEFGYQQKSRDIFLERVK